MATFPLDGNFPQLILGLVYAGSSLCGLVSPLDLPVVNVSGAGDAAAGIATGTLRGYDFAMKAALAVVLASHCAASTKTVADGLTPEFLIAATGRVRTERLWDQRRYEVPP